MDVEFLPDTRTHMCLHTRAHVPTHTLTRRTLGRQLRPTERAVLEHETVPPGTESLPGKGTDLEGGAELQPRRGSGCPESEQDRGWKGAEGRKPERGFRGAEGEGRKKSSPHPPPRRAEEERG